MNFIRALLCFLLLEISIYQWAQADSDGAGCYGAGYVAYEKHFEDDTGLYVVFFGNKEGISDPIRVGLPRSPGAYLFGIECDQEKILIALRGEEQRTASNIVEIPIYKTEISLMARPPKVVSDKKDYVQVWENYTTKRLKSTDGKDSAIIELPEPSINVKNPRALKNLELPADDKNHKYYLAYDTSGSSSTVKNGYGTISTHVQALIVQKDLNGGTNLQKMISESTHKETID